MGGGSQSPNLPLYLQSISLLPNGCSRIFSQFPCSRFHFGFKSPTSFLNNLPYLPLFPQSPVSQIPHRGHPGWRPFWKNFGQNRVDIARARAFIFVTRPFRIRFHLFLGYLFTTTYLKKYFFVVKKIKNENFTLSQKNDFLRKFKYFSK